MPACGEAQEEKEGQFGAMNITPDTFPKYTPNPLLADLPEHLKDPANYAKVQKALLETLATTHSHGELFDWFKCTPCMNKARDHKELMVKLGFKTPQHYKEWQRIHHIMRKQL